MVSSSDFEEINLSQLKAKLDMALKAEQYVFLHDPDNKAATYFQYMEKLFDYARERVKLAMKQTTDEELGKEFRKQFISAGIYGKKMAVNLGGVDLNMDAYLKDDVMNVRFFDYKDWVANCTELTTGAERYSPDKQNTDLPKYPLVAERFLMVFISTVEDKEEMLQKTAKLPGLEKMKKIYI